MPTHDLISAFSKAFAKARATRGMSQSEFAEFLGIATGYVSMLERGQRAPGLDMVMSIAEKLRVHPLDLLGR